MENQLKYSEPSIGQQNEYDTSAYPKSATGSQDLVSHCGMLKNSRIPNSIGQTAQVVIELEKNKKSPIF